MVQCLRVDPGWLPNIRILPYAGFVPLMLNNWDNCCIKYSIGAYIERSEILEMKVLFVTDPSFGNFNSVPLPTSSFQSDIFLKNYASSK